MGHLINPIAFRLSFFKSWEDSWFVRNIYYPEFLNGMLKLRNYLYFFLTKKRILKSGIFLNNFFIIKYNKIYMINIYIYHIDFERLSFDCINRLYSSFFSYNKGKKKKENIYKLFKLFLSNMDVYFFLIFFYKILKKKYKLKKKKKYLKFNFFFKSKSFKYYYNKIFTISNYLLINKLFNKNKILKENIKLEQLRLMELNKENLSEEQLIKKYKYNISENYNNLFFNIDSFKEYNYKSNKFNIRLNKNEKKKIYLKFNFTLFEFTIYLLKKIGFKFKSKIFSKIFKLKCALSFLNVLKYLNYKFIKLRSNYNFLLFFLVVLLKSILIHLVKNSSKNKIRGKIYFLLYNYLGYKFFFKELQIVIFFFNNIFFLLNKIKNITYKFFFLSNRNITARWLCRYIGLKLRNNYSFFSVVNPVKRELYKLCKLKKNRNKNKKLYNFSKVIKNSNLKYKLNFKNWIRNFFFIYIKENYIYYKGNNNYIYDLYIYFNNKKNKAFDFLNFIKLYKYIYINIFINCYWELNWLKKQKLLDIIINKIYNFILINSDNKYSLKLKNFYISAFFLNNLLNFNYFKYIWLQTKKINLRDLRSNSNNKLKYRSILVGFKLAFKGRFSRKQRASDIWYMRGKVPLNTLSVKLDYYFFTIPLKNSAISIKIILYKNLYNENFKYLLKF